MSEIVSGWGDDGASCKSVSWLGSSVFLLGGALVARPCLTYLVVEIPQWPCLHLELAPTLMVECSLLLSGSLKSPNKLIVARGNR